MIDAGVFAMILRELFAGLLQFLIDLMLGM